MPRVHVLARLAITLVALAAMAAPALAEGVTATPETPAAQLAAKRAARAARIKAQRAQAVARRRAEREAKAARERARREAETGTVHKPNGYVVITCTSVTYVFENFEPGPHTVTEIVWVDGSRAATTSFTFEGPSGSNVVPIAEPAGLHRIDARAIWASTAVPGRKTAGWDIPSRRTCSRKEAPGFVIEKRQKMEGESGWVPTPVVGLVGQVVDYEIVVTNTGGVTLTFGELSDPKCDPGTLTGKIPGGVLEPGAAAKFFCSHTITEADQAAGSYTNVASITGTPPAREPIPETSNTVVVEVPPPGSGGGGSGSGGGGGGSGGGGGGSGGGGGITVTPTSATGEIGVLGTTAGSPGSGVLGETASVPAISGAPVGCARPSFVVSVRSKGVRSVTFYLDNRRLKALTAKSARHGKLSIRINTTHLRTGRHRIKARIVMAPTAARARTLVASRSVTFVRCASSTLSPHFTG